MDCPICGKAMETGKLVTDNSRGLFFLPSDVKTEPVMDRFLLTKKKVEVPGGIVLDGPYNSNWPNRTELAASVCRSCRKILLDY